MTISINDILPASPLRIRGDDGIIETTLAEWAAGQKIVLLVVPGAFTPTCSARHLPSFVDHADAIKAKGVGAIGCLAVNDAFVMQAWGRYSNADGVVDMLADAKAETAKALGIHTVNAPVLGNTRAARMALIADDGVVSHVFIEDAGAYEVSSAENILANL